LQTDEGWDDGIRISGVGSTWGDDRSDVVCIRAMLDDEMISGMPEA
jgi:hypothetical protein